MKNSGYAQVDDLAVKVGDRGVPLLSGCIPDPDIACRSADVNPTHLELDCWRRAAGMVRNC